VVVGGAGRAKREGMETARWDTKTNLFEFQLDRLDERRRHVRRRLPAEIHGGRGVGHPEVDLGRGRRVGAPGRARAPRAATPPPPPPPPHHDRVGVAVDDVAVGRVPVGHGVAGGDERLCVVDHVAAKRGDRGRNLEARHLAHGRAREAVHRVGRDLGWGGGGGEVEAGRARAPSAGLGPSPVSPYLERQLAPVKHGLDKRVGRRFQVGLGPLARGEQLLQDLREDALGDGRPHKEVARRRFQHVARRHLALPGFWEQGGVAQVVGHHDGRVQAGGEETKRCTGWEETTEKSARRPPISVLSLCTWQSPGWRPGCGSSPPWRPGPSPLHTSRPAPRCPTAASPARPGLSGAPCAGSGRKL